MTEPEFQIMRNVTMNGVELGMVRVHDNGDGKKIFEFLPTQLPLVAKAFGLTKEPEDE